MSVARPSDIPGALTTSDARREAAAALRDLTIAFLCSELDDRGLQGLTASAREATALLTAAPPRMRTFDEISLEAEASDVLEDERADHFDACFVSGEASPFGLAARIHREGNGLVAEVRFTRAFEGMPGFAHGGIIMAVFDDIIGMTMGRLMRISAPTVRVETDFRKPVPLATDVVVRTTLDSEAGRKRYVSAILTVEGVVHAEASGLLIVLDNDRALRS